MLFASYNIRWSTLYDVKKQKVPLVSFMASDESVKGPFKQYTLKQHKLAQLDKVLYEWFTAVHSKGEPMTGRVITPGLSVVKVIGTV